MTPKTDALEKAVSLGMIGSQLFAEVRKMEMELEAENARYRQLAAEASAKLKDACWANVPSGTRCFREHLAAQCLVERDKAPKAYGVRVSI